MPALSELQMYYPHAAAFLVGVLLTFLVMRARISRAEGARDVALQADREARSELARLRDQAEVWRRQNEDSAARASGFEAELRARQEEQQGAQQQLAALRGQVETELKAVSVEALRDSQAQFLQFASKILDPMRETLGRYERGLAEMEQARRQEHGTLATELRNVVAGQIEVREQAARLARALRESPGTRGRWGERTLENVLDLAGMAKGVDYEQIVSMERDDQALRPDVVIRLPGGRSIAVESRVPLGPYLDAIEAAEGEPRDTRLGEHARQMRAHMRALAAKEYWDRLPHSPDFVVMFVPNDAVLAAALDRDAHLFDDAVKARVMIATPVTLVTLAKAIAFGWRQEHVARNAQEIEKLGRDLYERVGTMMGHVAALGRHVQGAVGAYNSFLGTLEARVLSQGRRFAELQVAPVDRPWPELATVDLVAQAPRTAEGQAADPG